MYHQNKIRPSIFKGFCFLNHSLRKSIFWNTMICVLCVLIFASIGLTQMDYASLSSDDMVGSYGQPSEDDNPPAAPSSTKRFRISLSWALIQAEPSDGLIHTFSSSESGGSNGGFLSALLHINQGKPLASAFGINCCITDGLGLELTVRIVANDGVSGASS